MRGVLLDIDGTLAVHDRALPGAVDALSALSKRRLAFRLLTNTTRRSRKATAAALENVGLDVSPEVILAPAILARRLILESGRPRVGLLVPDETRVDLEGLTSDETAPDWVVVADIGRAFTYDRLNTAFRWIRAGARLLALQKNPFWHASEAEGWVLDAGAFVAALEYATGTAAEVVGKPSPAFFRLALDELGLRPDEVVVVGDDPNTDAAGGAAAGCRTALVRTGKFGASAQAPSGLRPDWVLDSVADLISVIR